jgi:hypothetical protein
MRRDAALHVDREHGGPGRSPIRRRRIEFNSAMKPTPLAGSRRPGGAAYRETLDRHEKSDNIPVYSAEMLNPIDWTYTWSSSKAGEVAGGGETNRPRSS